MDSASFLALATACAPLVNVTTASAIVGVESGFNPHAIGVVGSVLIRQPRSRDEAVATARSLDAAGRNYSVGLAQINRHNFARLGLDSAGALEPCRNLTAMQILLIECLQRQSAVSAQAGLRKALSCYYSGNAVTGFRHGYVQRVVGTARRQSCSRLEASAPNKDSLPCRSSPRFVAPPPSPSASSR